MAVVVIDNRTLINEADATTGWTTSNSFTVYTTGPTPKELTGNLGFATSESEDYAYHTISSTDLSSTLIYVWTLVLGTEDTTANGGRQIYLGDGTDARGYYVGGSDGAGFRHDSGEVNWQCFMLDTADLPTGFTQHAGTVAPTLTTITQVGIAYVVGSKALGGGDNTYVDMVLSGNGGLSIVGGTTGARGTFVEIATIDAANTNYGGTEDASGARSSGTAGSSYGIIRELSSGVYGLSSAFTFGGSAETADSYFDDDGVVIVFENRITSAYWYLDAEGNSTYNVTFNLSNSTIKSAGPTITCDFTGGNINTLTFDTVGFVDLVGDIDFSNSADATGHSVTDCSFSNCGEIDPGDVTFTNNTIINSSDSLTGAVLLDADGTSNWSGLSFVSGGTGHAIYITATGTYTFTGFTYTGYGATTTTDAVIYNNSGGAVTINVSGGDTPTYRNGASATTTVNNTVTTLINIKDLDGDPEQDVRVYLEAADATGDLPFEQAITSIIRTGSTAAVIFTTDHGLVSNEYLKLEGITTDNQEDLSGAFQVTVTGATTLEYTTATSGAATYSGTITGTGATIYGTTDASGNISSSRTYGPNQPLTGYARKSDDGVNYFKPIDLIDTVDSGNGLIINRRLVSDGLV